MCYCRVEQFRWNYVNIIPPDNDPEEAYKSKEPSVVPRQG